MSHASFPPVAALKYDNPVETSYMRHWRDALPARAPEAASSSLWTPLTAISPWLVAAVVKAEDPRFFAHHGFDAQAVCRKALATMRGRIAPVGASTITQQLARNLYLTPARRVSRKARELVMALRLEMTLSKTRILELYLNLIEWGPDTWGCHAASRARFDALPAALGLFESTFLASLIAAPRVPLAGKNAVRARYVHLRVIHQLLLSGLASPAACCKAVDRVRRLHDALGAGHPLHAALDTACEPPPRPLDGDRVAWLTDLMRGVGIRTIPIHDALSARYGERQERAAWNALRRRFGQDALIAAVVTGDYARLR